MGGSKNSKLPKNLKTNTEEKQIELVKGNENIEDIEPTENQQKIVEEKTESKKKNKRLIPTSDIEMLLLAQRLLERMERYKDIEISWMSREEFRSLVEKFDLAIKLKYKQKDSRSPIVNELTLLDQEIDEKTATLKALLLLKYDKKSVKSHYGEYGLVKVNHLIKFPIDRGKRSQSLKKLVKSMEENQIDHPQYGLAYWKNICQRYNELLNLNFKYTQEFSFEVGNLSEYRKKIRQYISAFIQMLKIQYKQDEEKLKSYLRDLGILPEHY